MPEKKVRAPPKPDRPPPGRRPSPHSPPASALPSPLPHSPRPSHCLRASRVSAGTPAAVRRHDHVHRLRIRRLARVGRLRAEAQPGNAWVRGVGHRGRARAARDHEE
eukprot:7106308-Prymnesium_polylepis.1